MGSFNTDKIKSALVEQFGGAAKDWKRVEKFTNPDGNTERHFQNSGLNQTLAVVETAEGKLEIRPLAPEVAAPSNGYCFAVQMLNDGCEAADAHYVFVAPVQYWEETGDNDWEPEDENEEAAISNLLPEDAQNMSGGFWSWPSMGSPKQTALAVAKRGFEWREDLQDYVDEELTASLKKQLSKNTKTSPKSPRP